MKYFIKGLLSLGIILLALPILFPLFIIDIILILGGQDPFNTFPRKVADFFVGFLID